jgi:hypothetical protein
VFTTISPKQNPKNHIMDRKTLRDTYGIIGVGRTFALVDRDDYEYLRKWDWKLRRSYNGRLWAEFLYKSEKGRRVFYMHHAVCTRALGVRPGIEWACVAANGDTLDCRRENLSWRLKSEIKAEALEAGRLKAHVR